MAQGGSFEIRLGVATKGVDSELGLLRINAPEPMIVNVDPIDGGGALVVQQNAREWLLELSPTAEGTGTSANLSIVVSVPLTMELGTANLDFTILTVEQNVRQGAAPFAEANP